MREQTYVKPIQAFAGMGLSVLVFTSGPASAAVLTTLEYTESTRNFDWVFEVDDRPSLPTPFSITPDNATKWKPKFEWKAFLGGLPPEFQASGQHTSRYHEEDTAEGNPFASGFMKYALINKTNGGFEALFQDQDPDHPAIGGPHKDRYSLFWKRRNANDDVTFEFKGRHIGQGTPIAEPASLALLGVGIAALAVGVRKTARRA